jgi:hypothetical protein
MIFNLGLLLLLAHQPLLIHRVALHLLPLALQLVGRQPLLQRHLRLLPMNALHHLLLRRSLTQHSQTQTLLAATHLF